MTGMVNECGHPDRPHSAKGKCEPCYNRWYLTYRHSKPPSRMADCHPDRPHRSLGKCETCYQSDYRRGRRSIKPGYKPHEVKPTTPQAASSLRANLGIELEDRDAMVERQGGLCAVCGKEPDGTGSAGVLHVDHDHETGRIRGMLCTRCNVGIGMFRDDPVALSNAAQYLEAAKPLVERLGALHAH